MLKHLRRVFERLEGQPVKIFTDDGRVRRVIVLEECDGGVRCIDECGRLFLFELCHIDSIEEPQMELHRCRCRRDRDDDRDDWDREDK